MSIEVLICSCSVQINYCKSCLRACSRDFRLVIDITPFQNDHKYYTLTAIVHLDNIN